MIPLSAVWQKVSNLFRFITAEKGGVARSKGEEEKKKECTTCTEGKSLRRRDEKARHYISVETSRLLHCPFQPRDEKVQPSRQHV